MRKQFKTIASWHEAQPEHIKRLEEFHLPKEQLSEQKTRIRQQDANGQGHASQGQYQPKVPDRFHLNKEQLRLAITRLNNQRHHQEQQQPSPALHQQV